MTLSVCLNLIKQQEYKTWMNLNDDVLIRRQQRRPW